MMMAENSAKQAESGIGMSIGEMQIVDGLNIKVFPASCMANIQSPGVSFLPQNVGNGYVPTVTNART
jgi:hypothetical protein